MSCSKCGFHILDEPFVGIDLVSERIIMDTLKELKHQGKTVLIVHHDLSKVKKYFDNIILLNRNLIAHGSVESVFNEENLKKPMEILYLLERGIICFKILLMVCMTFTFYRML